MIFGELLAHSPYANSREGWLSMQVPKTNSRLRDLTRELESIEQGDLRQLPNLMAAWLNHGVKEGYQYLDLMRLTTLRHAYAINSFSFL